MLTTASRRRTDVDTPYGYGLDVGEDDGRTWIGHSGGMVGYTAFLSVEPASGLGFVILQNGSGDKEHVVGAALDAVRACINDDPLPDRGPPPSPRRSRRRRRSRARTRRDGRRCIVTADDDGLPVSRRPASGAAGTRSVDHRARQPVPGRCIPSSSASPSVPARRRPVASSRCSTATGGSATSATRGRRRTSRPTDGVGIPGLYRNDDPWMPTLRVVLRKGGWRSVPGRSGDEEGGELLPLDDGWFAGGSRGTRADPVRPRVDGKTALAVFNGGRWYRSFEK